jgi:hypothetical protein
MTVHNQKQPTIRKVSRGYIALDTINKNIFTGYGETPLKAYLNYMFNNKMSRICPIPDFPSIRP